MSTERHDAELAAAEAATALGRLVPGEPIPSTAQRTELAPEDADVIEEAHARADAADAAVVTMRALGAVADPTTGQPVPPGALFPAAGTLALLLARGGSAELAQERPWWWTGPTTTRPQAIPS